MERDYWQMPIDGVGAYRAAMKEAAAKEAASVLAHSTRPALASDPVFWENAMSTLRECVRADLAQDLQRRAGETLSSATAFKPLPFL